MYVLPAELMNASSWITRTQGHMLRTLCSGRPIFGGKKLQSPVIERASTDMPAHPKSSIREAAVARGDPRLSWVVVKPLKKSASLRSVYTFHE
jgi:hypothetical protein